MYFEPSTKNMGEHLNSKCGQRFLDSTKKSQQLMQSKLLQKEQSKRKAKATSNLIGNKTAYKITSVPVPVKMPVK